MTQDYSIHAASQYMRERISSKRQNKIKGRLLRSRGLRVLLLENIHGKSSVLFQKERYSVEAVHESLGETALANKIKNTDILGIRSKTAITKNILQSAKRLTAIGAFCIGTNQIDLEACQNFGVAVFNAPYSNTRSVVEMALGEIIMLLRGVFDKSMKMHKGLWDKTSRNSFEVRGKKLGIIGYGKIGSQLSVLAENLGMEVYYYDIVEKLALGNAKKCRSLKELLTKADVISVNVDGRSENKNLIGKREFQIMKGGAYILNLSRGFVIDLNALAASVKSEKVAGAALDVFPDEPKSNTEPFASQLQNLPNIILTPHIGGSTEEAQGNTAEYVSLRVIDYIKNGNTMMSVNFPNLQLPALTASHRFVHIHKNVPGILAQINSVFANRGVNIVGQYLKTNDSIGYVITDVNKKHDETVVHDLEKIENTIKVRVLY